MDDRAGSRRRERGPGFIDPDTLSSPVDPIDPRDREAAKVLARHLDEPSLPSFVPGEPRGLMAAIASRRLTPRILAELGEIYDVETWDADAFERHVLRGALLGWSPRARVLERDGTVTATLTVCPIGAVERDPRVCDLCQRTLEAMAERVDPRMEIAVEAHPAASPACRLTCRRPSPVPASP